MKEHLKKERKRLSLELSPEAYQLLAKLAADSDKNMADVLRAGIALYDIAYQAKAKHQALCVAEGDEILKEILLT